MHNDTDHQETKQISAALLETKVSTAEPESSHWSAASRKTGPSRGHLFSPDLEACTRDDPLQEHKESQSICSRPCHLGRGSANRRLKHQLLPEVSGWWRRHHGSSFTSPKCPCSVLHCDPSAHCCCEVVDVGARQAGSEECLHSRGIRGNRGCAARQSCGKW